MKISGILVDVSKSPGSVTEYSLDEKNLEEFYEALKCRTIDIVQRSINGKVYDIVCDDEGLFVDQPITSAVNSNGSRMLVWNLFVCNHKGPELTSLSKDDVTHIMQSVGVIAIEKPYGLGIKVSPVLTDVRYVGECM